MCPHAHAVHIRSGGGILHQRKRDWWYEVPIHPFHLYVWGEGGLRKTHNLLVASHITKYSAFKCHRLQFLYAANVSYIFPKWINPEKKQNIQLVIQFLRLHTEACANDFHQQNKLWYFKKGGKKKVSILTNTRGMLQLCQCKWLRHMRCAVTRKVFFLEIDYISGTQEFIKVTHQYALLLLNYIAITWESIHAECNYFATRLLFFLSPAKTRYVMYKAITSRSLRASESPSTWRLLFNVWQINSCKNAIVEKQILRSERARISRNSWMH